MGVFRGVMRSIAKWRRSESGNIAIVSAMLMPALVGFLGLGCETAYWYYRQRDLQGAADIAAFDHARVDRHLA